MSAEKRRLEDEVDACRLQHRADTDHINDLGSLLATERARLRDSEAEVNRLCEENLQLHDETYALRVENTELQRRLKRLGEQLAAAMVAV